MNSIIRACLAVAVVTAVATGAAAFVAGTGHARMTLPADYATRFVIYDKVDKPERKRVRFMYINREALDAARPGQPFPNGTILIMEDHEVELDAAGNPLRDAAGRLRPTQVVSGIFVMEKREGWGALIPPESRNGDWDYAVFRPDRTPQVVQTQACFACHLPQAGANDFTFTTAAFVAKR